MKYTFLILIAFLFVSSFSFAQDKKSKGDDFFFEYKYPQAIVEYKKEKNEKPLSKRQLLNLADSYLQTGNYKNATDTYLEIYKEDTKISTYHFNNMLQAMAKTSGQDRVKAFLATKTDVLSNELLENAEFNYELQDSEKANDLDYQIFNINSNGPASDFSPSFYKNDKLLFTSTRSLKTSKKKPNQEKEYLEIFVAKVGIDGQILNPNPFLDVPASEFHQATPFYSETKDAVFYVSSNEEYDQLTFDENGKNSLAIMMTSGDGTAQYLLRDPSTSFYYPFYDATTSRLYFAANFPDGYGGTDIYYVDTNEGKIMSAPINLGSRINTPGNEVSPFVFENSLYFASDIFYGMGGMDIYKSEMQGDEFFSIPVNLGLGLNSEEDDFGFIIKNNKTEGLTGYFSSNRAEGKGKDDIYGFNVDEKPGLKTLVLRGQVKNSISKEGVSKAAVRIYDTDQNLIREIYSKEDGTYRLEIPWRESLMLEVSKERYSASIQSFDETAIKGLDDNNIVDMELLFLDDLVEEKEDQTVIKLKKFYFQKGNYKITPEVAAELDKAVIAIKSFPQLQLRIESHTDSRGGGATNFRLSQRRADAMKDYLEEHGVSSSNILYSIGYGEDKIINICKNGVFCLEQLHNENERQLIVVLNYDLIF
ncbi:OmpA family protein [uncultured Eudoraea sp.]|uniref:OmpA family protein n=1 Tax=uncultured Eudoraea sp. TaxID=1035614 RepID=UPI002615C22E|nr:OmpA family protein [uncultured Eudoraea sp.]